MKKFKEFNFSKKIIIMISLVVVLLITVVVLLRTYAILETSQEYDVIKGVVPTYDGSDLKISVMIDGTLEKDFPKKNTGYYFKNVTCNNDAYATFSNASFTLTVLNISSKTKCVAYFETEITQNLKEIILESDGGIEQIKSKLTPDFSKNSSSTLGMYASQDDYGETFYFRGDVKNNFVFFANFYWRVIRINGDGSIRMIYAGKTQDAQKEDSGVFSSSFSESEYDNAQVGYMFGNMNATDYQSAHQNLYSSSVKSKVDLFYDQFLKEYENDMSDTLFCNDRSVRTHGTKIVDDTAKGYGKNITYYNAWYRFLENTPTFSCLQQNDRFTVANSIGNAKLTYPIALITADEINFSGAIVDDATPSNHYLNTLAWTTSMTPAAFYKNLSDMYDLRGYGDLYLWDTHTPSVIRPVINLKPTTTITHGDGTQSNPYRIS